MMHFKILILALFLIGCAPSDENALDQQDGFRKPAPPPSIGQCGPQPNFRFNLSKPKNKGYEFQIFRDKHNVPHIRARSLEELSFASGYAFAEDKLCEVQQQLLLMKGESAKFFGPHKFEDSDILTDGDMFYLVNDLFSKTFEFSKKAEYDFPQLSNVTKLSFNSYAKGIEQYKSKSNNNCSVDVQIQGYDIYAYFLYVSALKNFKNEFINMIADKLSESTKALWKQSLKTPAYSLMYGEKLNEDKISSKMFFASHAYYDSAFKEYEMHLLIPNQLNVYGVAQFAFPFPQVGFNDNVAWSHTPDKKTATKLLYKLPVRGQYYIYEDTPYLFENHLFEIPYKAFGGGQRKWSVVLKSSHLGWSYKSEEFSYSIMENLTSNTDMIDHWLSFTQAQSVIDIKESHTFKRGMPDVNTIAIDQTGKVLYINSSRAFNLSLEAQNKLQHGFTIPAQKDNLPQTNQCSQSLVTINTQPSELSRKELWSVENTLLPSNPTRLSPIYGQNEQPSLRDKMAYHTIKKTMITRPFQETRSYLITQEKQSFLNACTQLVQQKGLNPKFCKDLKQWNGKFDGRHYLEVVFNEFFKNTQLNYQVPFNHAEPYTTPRKLIVNKEFKEKLYRAFQEVSELELAKPIKKVYGAPEGLGSLNIAAYKKHAFMNETPIKTVTASGLALNEEAKAYYPVNLGPSWLMDVEFKNNKPVARGVLVYGNKAHFDTLNTHLRSLNLYSSGEYDRLPYQSYEENLNQSQ